MSASNLVWTALNSNETDYSKKSKPLLDDLKAKKSETAEKILKNCKSVLQDYSRKPMMKLLALRLIKDSVDQDNILFIQLLSSDLLPEIQNICRFKKHLKDDKRGETYFNDKPDINEKKIGNTYLRLALECVKAWADMFEESEKNGGETKFSKTYGNLLNEGVKFPDDINYFKKYYQNKQLKKVKNDQTPNSEDPLAKIERLISINEANKSEILTILENEVLGSDLRNNLSSVIAKRRQYNADFPDLITELTTVNNDKVENYINFLCEEIEFNNKLFSSYGDFENKIISYETFRSQYIGSSRLKENGQIKEEPHSSNRSRVVGSDDRSDRRVLLLQPNFDDLEQQEEVSTDQKEKSEEDPHKELTHREFKSEIQIPSDKMDNSYKEKPAWKSDLILPYNGGPKVSFKVMFEEEEAQKLKLENHGGRPSGSKMRREKNPFNLETSPYRNKLIFENNNEQENHHDKSYYILQKTSSNYVNNPSQEAQTDPDPRLIELERENQILREEMDVKQRQLEEGQQLFFEFAKKEEEIKELQSKIEALENEKNENKFNNNILPADLGDSDDYNEQLKLNENLVAELAQLESKNKGLNEDVIRLNHTLREMELENAQNKDIIERLKFQNELLAAQPLIEKNGSDKISQKELNDDSGFYLNGNSNNGLIQDLEKRNEDEFPEIKNSSLTKSNPVRTEETLNKQEDRIMKNKIVSPSDGASGLRLSNYLSLENREPEQKHRFQQKKAPNPSQQTWRVDPKAEENFDSEEEPPQKLREHFENESRLSDDSTFVEKSDYMAQKEPLYSELIYPFNKPSEYYTKKPQKKYKGKIVKMDKFLFKDVDSQSDLVRFKLACLKERASLAEAESFQIGMISELYQYERKNYLKITMYLGNKSDYNKIDNFLLQYVGSNDMTLFLKPDTLPTDIPARTQIKQELIIDFTRIPFPVIISEFSYRTPGNLFNFRVPIPMTINKFLEEKVTDKTDFILLWRELKSKGRIYRTEPFDLNRKIARNAFEIKNYFKNLVELNPQKEYDYLTGGGELKLGGIYEMTHEIMNSCELLLKIVAKPNKQLVLMAAFIETNESLIKFILNTLAYLFMK